jgi:hypothetical protein
MTIIKFFYNYKKFLKILMNQTIQVFQHITFILVIMNSPKS